MLRSQALGDAVVGALFGIALLMTPMALVSWGQTSIGNGTDLADTAGAIPMIGAGIALWMLAIVGLVGRMGLLHRTRRPS